MESNASENQAATPMQQLQDTIMQAEGEIDAGLNHLSKGKKLIRKRQKLINLVDREEEGWNFVKEYTRDKLADDTDDDKAILKTRKAATAKRLTSKKQRSRGRIDVPYRRRASYPYSGQSSTATSRQPFRNGATSRRGTDFRRNQYDRECYICNSRGHLQYNCPNNTGRY